MARTRSFPCDAVAAVLALTAVAVMSVIALVEPAVADRLTLENGVVEWPQVILDAGAALLFGRDLVRNAWSTGRLSPLDLAIVSCLIGLILGEVDLDKVLFGTKVISTRVFVSGKVAIQWRLLVALVVVGLPVAIAVFVVARFCVFWRE